DRAGVGLGEGVDLLALGGDADVVDHEVVAVHVEPRDEGVPFGLDVLGRRPESFGDAIGDLLLEADELAGAVVEGVGAVGALEPDAHGAALLDAGEDLLAAAAAVGGTGASLGAAGRQDGEHGSAAEGEGKTTGGARSGAHGDVLCG